VYNAIEMLTLTIDRSDAVPVYEQVASQIRRLIAGGDLPVGALLPPVRRLAGDLGVGLNTIARAYRALGDEGFLVTRDRVGVEVAAPARPADGAAPADLLESLRVTLGMTEADVMNLFTVLRGLIVGGFFFSLPLIARKGLLFGVYVGETAAVEEPARLLKRAWFRASSLLTLAAIVLGLAVGVSGRPMAGTFACVGLLFGACPVLYLRFHFRARTLASPAASRQGKVAVASLAPDEAKGEVFAKVSLGLCLAAGLAALAHAALAYDTLPARVPAWFGLSGDPAALAPRSIGSVMVPSLLSLVLAPTFALFGLLIAGAKRSLRGGAGGGSAAAQAAFRAALSRLFSGMALFTCAFTTYLSVQFIRIELHQAESIGIGILVIALPMVLFAAGSLLRLLTRYGQGGAYLEDGSPDAPLTNGIASDGHWLWGLLYFNRDDPSLMVEKRFGLGYTMNLGNARCLAFVLLVPALLITIAVLAVLGATA
jgi:uncharacterized membrane protein/DNA-binding transcriptional regulator YhcF (GntR family)